MTARHLASLLLVLLVALPASGAAATEFSIQLTNENGVPSTNATLTLSRPDGSEPTRFQTDSHGRTPVDVPNATYLVRAYLPNETGEQWYERVLRVDPSGDNLTLRRNLPTFARRPELANATVSSDGQSYTLPLGGLIDVHIAVRYGGEAGARQLQARATVTRGADVLQQAGFALGNFSGSGWLNGTLPSDPAHPYNDQEGSTRLVLGIYQNGTDTLFDAFDPITLVFRDACPGDVVEIRVALGNATLPLCDAAGAATAWADWNAKADALRAADAEWKGRFIANATAWSTDETMTAWLQFENATADLRRSVHARLDAAQTDDAAFPTWAQVQAVRNALDADHATISALHADAARDAASTERTDAWIVRTEVLGLILLVAAAATGITLAASGFVLQRWKARSEYWMGYSSQTEIRTPLWTTFGILAGAFALGILLTFLGGGLWRILGGT